MKVQRSKSRVHIGAQLRSLMPAISPARRLVRLQAKQGRRWLTIATARTNVSGRVRWAVRPTGGQRLRVRYLGASDLMSVSSRFVRVAGRPLPARKLAGHAHVHGHHS
jgi:hypothetical protein